MKTPSRAPSPPQQTLDQATQFITKNRWAMFALGGVVLFLWIIVCVAGGLLVYQGFKPPAPGVASPGQVLSGQIPPAQQTDCGAPTLTLGAVTYHIEALPHGADGSISVPANIPGTAYWIDGSEPNYIFALSPTPQNLMALAVLKPGDPAVVTWSNCNSTTYTLSTPEQAPQDEAAFINQLDPSALGIAVLVQNTPSNPGLLVKGGLAEEKLVSIPTPQPGGSEVQAEVTLLDTVSSPDGKTIKVGASIMNYGQSALTLAASDVSLTPENGAPLAPVKAEPALPRKIKPGASETVYFTFTRPASATAVLKIYSVEYDLEGY
jgi:hypothetical protein